MRIKRDSKKYTIEVVVAVDQNMVDYYGGELYDVVASAMALTSNVYENSNIKQSFSVSLLDVLRLPMDPLEGAGSPNSGMYTQNSRIFSIGK